MGGKVGEGKEKKGKGRDKNGKGRERKRKEVRRREEKRREERSVCSVLTMLVDEQEQVFPVEGVDPEKQSRTLARPEAQ